MFPLVAFTAAFMFTLFPALNRMLPPTVVMGAFTLTSRPQHTTRFPLVGEIAALRITSRAALNVRVDVATGVQVSAAATVISPDPTPGAPLFVVVTVILVPAFRKVWRPPATKRDSKPAALTPLSGAKTPPATDPLLVAAPTIVTSAGSSSHMPPWPFAALALM